MGRSAALRSARPAPRQLRQMFSFPSLTERSQLPSQCMLMANHTGPITEPEEGRMCALSEARSPDAGTLMAQRHIRTHR